MFNIKYDVLSQKTQQTLLCERNYFELILICFSDDLFPHCYVAKQFFRIQYFTDILSFEKFSKNLHRNLKLIFFFSMLFVHFEIGYRQSYITVLRISFFFL